MPWTIVESTPCDRRDQTTLYRVNGLGGRLRHKYWGRSRPRTACPSGGADKTALEAELVGVVNEALASRGYDYEPSGGRAPFLWCLGGLEVLVHPDEEPDEEVEPQSCVDLTVYACAEHQVVEVSLFPHQMNRLELGAEWPAASDAFATSLGKFLDAHLNF